jgi:hypothetical protein
MKANPEKVVTSLPTPGILRSLGLWLGVFTVSVALAFAPEVEHKLQGPGLGAYSQFGTVVDISGDTAVVGCPGFQIDNAWVGAALVFVYRENQWTHEATLIPVGAPADTDFGSAVAISGDTIVVGAYRDGEWGPFAGKAYVFTRTAQSWQLETILTPDDAQSQLQFGDPVAIDQDRIAVGAIADSQSAAASGAVYLFRRGTSGWEQETKLKADLPAAGAIFGFSLSLNADLLAVGAPFHTHSGIPSAGSAYLFQVVDGTWSQLAHCVAEDPAANALLGWSVAVTPGGLLTGSPLAQNGLLTSGAAYLFQPSNSTWIQTEKLIDSLAVDYSWFGFYVAMHEDVAAVGASQDPEFGTAAGAISLFSIQDGFWQQTRKFNVASPSAGAQFGFNIAFDGNHLVAGAPFQDEPLAPLTGAAYAFSSADIPQPNAPPTADASATPKTVLAVNGSEAEAYLDGSRSSDPEGAALAYRWLLDDQVVAETQTASVSLGVGTHTLHLEVSDGFNLSSDTVQIEVITPADLLNDIIDQLDDAGFPAGQTRALQLFLTNARRALERNQLDQALHHLQTACDYLRAHAGQRLEPSTALAFETILDQFADILAAP